MEWHKLTEVADLNTARQYLGDNGGTNTDTITSGGYTSTYVANTELWNGTAWTETTDMNSTRGWGASLGTSSSLLYMGGTPPEATTATEEWEGAGQPIGAWSTGGSLNSGKFETAGSGNKQPL